MTFEEVYKNGGAVLRIPENRNYFLFYTSRNSLRYLCFAKNAKFLRTGDGLDAIVDKVRWISMGAEDWEEAVLNESTFKVKQKKLLISRLFENNI